MSYANEPDEQEERLQHRLREQDEMEGGYPQKQQRWPRHNDRRGGGGNRYNRHKVTTYHGSPIKKQRVIFFDVFSVNHATYTIPVIPLVFSDLFCP